MMLLALDTTAAVATVALFRDGALVAELEADAGKKHAQTVLPMMEQLLEENGVAITQIDYFAVDIGPGSFTGVRIGVSLVNALAFATGKPIVPVDALRVLAAAAGDTDQPVCALIDARNGNAYAAVYHKQETVVEPCAVEMESFLTRVPADAKFVGDTHTMQKVYPRASLVGAVAHLRLDTAVNETEPIYLRASQAERLRQNPSEEV